jgi:hypothetical protein
MKPTRIAAVTLLVIALVSAVSCSSSSRQESTPTPTPTPTPTSIPTVTVTNTPTPTPTPQYANIQFYLGPGTVERRANIENFKTRETFEGYFTVDSQLYEGVTLVLSGVINGATVEVFNSGAVTSGICRYHYTSTGLDNDLLTFVMSTGCMPNVGSEGCHAEAAHVSLFYFFDCDACRFWFAPWGS